MNATIFANLFVAALIVSVALKLWLSTRQSRHVALNRARVPAEFSARIGIDAHQRAADYTLARLRLGIIDLFVGTVFLVLLTLLGGLQWFEDLLTGVLPDSPFARQILLVVGVVVAGSLIELPISLYRQFRLEARFGFNRMTVRLFLLDLAKGTLIGAALGVPLLAVVLWLMVRAGEHWWLWTWLVWIVFNLFVLVLYPTVIAPLFNKFEPLADEAIRARVERLLARCGFATKGLFVMDGSRRSSHGNAYFTGLGKAKRIVFFDTLLARLTPTEIEAVLAHELGHFKHRHILKRIVFSFAGSLAGLWLLGYLSQQPWFYQGLGVAADPADRAGLALILFFLAMPVFMVLFQPVFSHLSRRHEFQADAFAAEHTRPQDLVSALVKLYEDNAATLTPDPIHSAFYDSHPPAGQRIGRLTALIRAPQATS